MKKKRYYDNFGGSDLEVDVILTSNISTIETGVYTFGQTKEFTVQEIDFTNVDQFTFTWNIAYGHLTNVSIDTNLIGQTIFDSPETTNGFYTFNLITSPELFSGNGIITSFNLSSSLNTILEDNFGSGTIDLLRFVVLKNTTSQIPTTDFTIVRNSPSNFSLNFITAPLTGIDNVSITYREIVGNNEEHIITVEFDNELEIENYVINLKSL